jgi:hypothetical protein
LACEEPKAYLARTDNKENVMFAKIKIAALTAVVLTTVSISLVASADAAQRRHYWPGYSYQDSAEKAWMDRASRPYDGAGF